jgi:hypothetical protein
MTTTTKHISWHVFRHTFSTLLIKNGEDVKTVQSMMRHQNARVTLEAYTDTVTDKKRMAQSRIVASILPRDAKALIVPVGGGMIRHSRENPYQERFLTGRSLSCVVLCLLQEGQQRRKLLKDMVGTWGLEPQTSTVSNLP